MAVSFLENILSSTSTTTVAGVAIAVAVVFLSYLRGSRSRGRCAYPSRPAPGSVPVPKVLNTTLLHPNDHAHRERLHKLLVAEKFHANPGTTLPLREQRELALARLRILSKSGLVDVNDLTNDPWRFFAAHECVSVVDASTATKMTVQWNLFGGTILALGTERHTKKYLSQVNSLGQIGCFALTELTKGNNASEMETVAVYDAGKDEFVIDTPSTGAQKYWITNGADHANLAVVFAQLECGGEQRGVHAFVVPIRDASGAAMPGVKIEDMGFKMALNGVDNAKLSFSGVRVPRDNLLDRYSQVAKGGAFTSQIERIHLRFLVVADRLLSGRICLSSFGLGGAKCVLALAVRYSAQRTQFAPSGEPAWPILRYLSQQRALFPRLAETYALTVALGYCKDRFSKMELGERSTIGLICALKPLCTWNLIETGAIARERCGGQGFLSSNAIGRAMSEGHAAVTAEGDNVVLSMKAARERLVRFNELVKRIGALPALAGRIARRAAFAARSPLREIRTIAGQQEVLREAEERLLFRVAGALRGKRGARAFHVWNDNLVDVLALARAYGERVAHGHFAAAVAAVKDDAARAATERLVSLYGLNCIQRAAPAFASVGVVSTSDLSLISDEISNLCEAIYPDALDLVAGFGIPDEILEAAPIAGDYVKFNEMK